MSDASYRIIKQLRPARDTASLQLTLFSTNSQLNCKYVALGIAATEESADSKLIARRCIDADRFLLHDQHCGEAGQESCGAVDQLGPDETLLAFGKQRDGCMAVL